MGRTSDYTKQVRNEEYENSVETTKKSAKSFADIKRMFAKEPMTAEQFGIYLGGCKAAGDFISDKTIKRYIEKLCKMSDGKITASKFMKTVDGTEVYIIQPEIQELLVAMFDTDFFGAKGKPKAGIDVKQRQRFYNSRASRYHSDSVIEVSKVETIEWSKMREEARRLARHIMKKLTSGEIYT